LPFFSNIHSNSLILPTPSGIKQTKFKMALTPPVILDQCVYLDEKTACGPEFYGAPVEASIYPSYEDFQEQMTSLSDPQFLANRFAERYGCVASDNLIRAMNQVRYVRSFWCSAMTYYALAGYSPNPPTCKAPTGIVDFRPFGPLLCAEQCSEASTGLINILKDPVLCPNPNSENTARVLLYERYCIDMSNAMSGNDVGKEACIKGTPRDLQLAGE
jgi:hypothetical protein